MDEPAPEKHYLARPDQKGPFPRFWPHPTIPWDAARVIIAVLRVVSTWEDGPQRCPRRDCRKRKRCLAEFNEEDDVDCAAGITRHGLERAGDILGFLVALSQGLVGIELHDRAFTPTEEDKAKAALKAYRDRHPKRKAKSATPAPG